MSDDGNDIEDEALDAAEEAASEVIKKYVRPRIRSLKIPIPRAAPSSACGPYACHPQYCSPLGPCSPSRP